MPPKNAAKPKTERAARRASNGANKPKAPAKTKRVSKKTVTEPTITETSPFITTTTSPDADNGKRQKVERGEKQATPVPIKLIKDLQARLLEQLESQVAAGEKPKQKREPGKYSQDELKNILNVFWDSLKHELIHGEGHKVSLMNYMTFRLVFRDGQKFTPPKNDNSKKIPAEVTKPPRWNLSVNIKDKLKTELQAEFARAHSDIVRAFTNGRDAKEVAVQQGLIRPKRQTTRDD